MRGIRYSQFIAALSNANILLNRKMLSEIAIHDPMTFDSLAAHVPGAHKPHVEALAK
jgi:large subunit ribosomal protein L20